MQLIRDLFTKTSGKQPIDFPKPLPILDYGRVPLTEAISLVEALPQLFPGGGIKSEYPERMENYNQTWDYATQKRLLAMTQQSLKYWHAAA